MYIEIVNGVISLLKDRLEQAAKLVAAAYALPLKFPNIRAYISTASMEPLGQSSVKLKPQVNVLLEIQNLSSEAKRMELAGLLAEAVIAALAFQDLGLEIDELLPVSVNDVTTKDDNRAGILKHLVTFQTGFTLEKMEDEDAAELMSIGLEYYLQEPTDDGVADMEDVVAIE